MTALLDRLEALAKAADMQTAALSNGQSCPWFDAHSIAVKLDMDEDDPDVAYIAAAAPDVVGKLIEVARAAQAAYGLLDLVAPNDPQTEALERALFGLLAEPSVGLHSEPPPSNKPDVPCIPPTGGEGR